MANDDYAKNQRELARHFGISPGYAAVLASKPWCPRKTDLGYHIPSVSAAIEAHVTARSRLAPRDGVPATTQTDATRGGGAAAGDSSAAAVAALRDTSDPRATARAAVQIAGAALADATERGELTPRFMAGMESTLRELRRTEAAWLELQDDSGRLVDRDVARAVGAWVARVCVVGLDRLLSLLAGQIEQWIGDPAWRGLRSEERAAVVHMWAELQVRELREAGAAEIEARIDEERAEARGEA